MAATDGLSESEKVNILFKNYMNFPSMKSAVSFDSESNQTFSTNIFGSSVMSEVPPTLPTMSDIADDSAGHQAVVDLLTSNSSGLNVDITWVSTKYDTNGAKFRKDTKSGTNDSILRFERLKLDYAGGNTAGFICKDVSGQNILRNLIPNSYSTDVAYTLSLEYEDDFDTTIGDAYWLQKRQTTLGDGGIDKQWGAPLFDAKNGIITFYDVADMDDPQSVFDSTKYDAAYGSSRNSTTPGPPTFYLTATKYVGAFGVGSSSSSSGTTTTVSGGVWEQDAGTLEISYGDGNVIIEKDLDVSGQLDVSAVIVQNRLDVMGDVSLNGRVDISGSFYVNGVEISGSGGGSWDNSGNNTTTGNLAVGGNITLGVGRNITLGGNDVATETYVQDAITYATLSSGGSSSGGGGSVSIETNQLGISTILASDPLDLSAGYKSHHKSNQPPAFEYHNSSQEEAVTSQSSSITVQWEDFAKKFIDAFTGRAFPLSFQTYVDISYTNFGDTSDNTGGWKTIFIGKGTYDGSGARVNPDLSFVIPNNATTTAYTDNTGGLGIPFTGKEFQDDTFSIPPFTQSDTFDLRVYPVNQSQETPNYLIYTGISLASTNKPGPVTIINFDSVGSASIQMDLSFNLDVSNSTASGIPMKSYDISYNQVATRSLVSGYSMHSASLTNINVESESSPKDNIAITGLYPGAQYEIQVSAQNSLATGLPFGDYGDPSNSEFTQVATDRYITTSELTNPSNSLAMVLKNGTTGILFYISGTSYNSTPVANTTSGYIDITGQAEFYVNYGKQGKSLTEAADNTVLVDANIYSKKNNVQDKSITFQYQTNGTEMSGDLPMPNNVVTGSGADSIFDDGGSNDYTFQQAISYTDKASVDNPKNKGFVYSSTLGLDLASQSLTEANKILMFANTFPKDSLYSANYVINGTQLNHSASPQITGGSGNFVVDDYTSTPQFDASMDTLTATTTPTSSNTLCGIPSLSKLKISLDCPTISDFKGYITPYVSNNHSIFTVTSNNAGFTAGQAKSGEAASNISSYSPTYTQEKTYGSQTYLDADSFYINVDVYYLGRDSSNKPERKTISAGTTGANASYKKIFRDSNFSAPSNMYLLTTAGGFSGGAYSASNSINHTQLIYFDGKIVGSLYQNSHGIGPFQDWSDSTWAVVGPNYNDSSTTTSVNPSSGITFTKNDGSTSGTYKWIVFNVTTTLASDQQLSNFKFVKNTDVTQITANDNPNRTNNHFASFMIYYDPVGLTYNFGSMEVNYSTGNSGNQWYDAGASVGASPNMSAASGKNGAWHPVDNNIKMSGAGIGEQYYLAIGINVSAGDNSHITF